MTVCRTVRIDPLHPMAYDLCSHRLLMRCTVPGMKSLLWSRPQIHTESSWLTCNHYAVTVPMGASFWQVGVISMQVPVLGKAIDVSFLPSSFWHCVRQAASKERVSRSVWGWSLCVPHPKWVVTSAVGSSYVVTVGKKSSGRSLWYLGCLWASLTSTLREISWVIN